jgi:hypothetical protein
MTLRAVRLDTVLSLPVLAAALVALASAGCERKAHDLTTVKGAYAAYLDVAESGRYEEMYPLLVPDLQKRIAMTHANIRKAQELVDRHYPPELRRQALSDIGPEPVRRAATPAAYFAARVGESGRRALSVGEKLGSRIKRIEEKSKNSGHFQVVTVSGATLEFYQGPTGFSVVLDPDDIEGVNREFYRSMAVLTSVQDLVKTLSGGPAR